MAFLARFLGVIFNTFHIVPENIENGRKMKQKLHDKMKKRFFSKGVLVLSTSSTVAYPEKPFSATAKARSVSIPLKRTCPANFSCPRFTRNTTSVEGNADGL
jgi:hypothetical protein